MSERVEAELREIDSAATSLTRSMNLAESHREQNRHAPDEPVTEADKARALLADLGVTP
ncbi:MAG: hypothetical protein QM658_10960 [Gordonia sp. (in: high G+C Gram-positive bacteria)]